jgi:hypothetical protein
MTERKRVSGVGFLSGRGDAAWPDGRPLGSQRADVAKLLTDVRQSLRCQNAIREINGERARVSVSVTLSVVRRMPVSA